MKINKNSNNNNNDTTKPVDLEKFSDHGGLFDMVIKPMFQQGHEGELCQWLKDYNLIKTSMKCTGDDCKDNKILKWNTSRTMDRYNWACLYCRKKYKIRDGSFFSGVISDFKVCLQLILAWCQDFPMETAAELLGIKEHIVKNMYGRCTSVAEDYLNNHPEDFVFGGPGHIVLVDEFPCGFVSNGILDAKTIKKRNNNNTNPILCIAEITWPPKMWLKIMEATPEAPCKIKYDETEKKTVGERSAFLQEGINEIMRHILPESCIVANNQSRCCNYDSLKELKQYQVFSIEYLQKFDPPDSDRLFENLKTIWQICGYICEEIQEKRRPKGKQIIAQYLWRQRYGSPSSSFETMLNHITESYRFQ